MEIINTELDDHEYKLLDWDATVKLNILPGLSTQVTYSNQYIGGVGAYFTPSTNNKTNRSEASRSYNQVEKNAVEWLGNYIKSFGDHNLKAMVGYSWQKITNSGFSAANKMFPNDERLTCIGREMGFQRARRTNHIKTFSYASSRINILISGNISNRSQLNSQIGINNKWIFPAVPPAENFPEIS